MIRVDPRDPPEIYFFHAEYAELAETIRMVSTNKVCALPRILRIPRETFLLGSIFFFLTTDLAQESEPMRLVWRV
jgi:hypothetical protein